MNGCHNSRQSLRLPLCWTTSPGTNRLLLLTAMNPSSESNLRSLFETALTEYEKQARTNLLDNRIIVKLQSCDSADAINAVLQEQAQAFHSFRDDDGKLNKWLKRTVHVLHELSTSSVLGAGIGLVRCRLFRITFCEVYFLTFFIQAISTCKCHLRRNRYPSHCRYFLIGLIGQDLTMSIVFRPSRTSTPATTPLSTYSNLQRTFSDVSTYIPRSHLR